MTILSTLKQRNDNQSIPLRRTIIFLIIPIGVLLTLVISGAYANNSACGNLEGSTYRSPKEVDNIVGGIMHPEISFSDGGFVWVVTDLVLTGAYECKSGQISAYFSHNSAQVAVRLDPQTGNLLWEGEMYERISKIP